MTASNVTRLAWGSFTPEEFHRNFRRPGRPALITGALDRIAPLSLQTILDDIGDRKVPIRRYGPDRFTRPKVEWREYCHVDQHTVREFADLLSNGTASRDNLYLAQTEIGHTALRAQVGPVIDALAQATGLRQQLPLDINLWIAPGGHTEPLHFDSHDGTLLQLRGAKQVALFRPEQSENLYPFGTFSGGLPPWMSQVYIDQPDFDRFPLLRQALAAREDIVVEEGQVLFIPSGWWHEVTALGSDYVVSANRFWKVDPLWRLASTPRAAAVYLLNRLPTAQILALHRWILSLKGLSNPA